MWADTRADACRRFWKEWTVTLLMIQGDAWDDGLIRMGGNGKNTLFYIESCVWGIPVDGWFE